MQHKQQVSLSTTTIITSNNHNNKQHHFEKIKRPATLIKPILASSPSSSASYSEDKQHQHHQHYSNVKHVPKIKPSLHPKPNVLIRTQPQPQPQPQSEMNDFPPPPPVPTNQSPHQHQHHHPHQVPCQPVTVLSDYQQPVGCNTRTTPMQNCIVNSTSTTVTSNDKTTMVKNISMFYNVEDEFKRKVIQFKPSI